MAQLLTRTYWTYMMIFIFDRSTVSEGVDALSTAVHGGRDDGRTGSGHGGQAVEKAAVVCTLHG